MKLYHFTSPMHLGQILATGVIRPSESNISLSVNDFGPRVVWLLDTETVDYPHGLEVEANKGTDFDKTRARFTVDVPAIRWVNWSPAWTAMEQWWRDVLVTAGGGETAAEHWWVFPASIRANRWIEVRLDGQSIPIP